MIIRQLTSRVAGGLTIGLGVAILFALFGLVGGSTAKHREQNATDRQNTVKRRALPEYLQYDLGHIIAQHGKSFPHEYVLTNELAHSIKVLRLINEKPCCGTVKAIQPTSLEPGESISLTVFVKPPDEGGILSHRALVELDTGKPESIKLITDAKSHPALRVEDESGGAVRLLPGEKHYLNYTLYSYGDSVAQGENLNDLSFTPESKASWVGPTETTSAQNGIVENRRKFTLPVFADEKIGNQVASLALKKGDKTVFLLSYQWTVMAPIQAVPTAVILSSSSNSSTSTVIIKAQKELVFRILGYTTKFSGVKMVIDTNAEASMHSVSLELVRTADNQGHFGEIQLETNHPEQKFVTIRVLVTGVDSSRIERGTSKKQNE